MVVVHGTVLGSLFAGWSDAVTGGAVLGQWGRPASPYLSQHAGVESPLYTSVIPFSAANALVAAAVLVNYLRRGRRPGPRTNAR